MGGDSVETRNRKTLKEVKMKNEKFIKISEQDFKSLFDDYEIWNEKLKEIQRHLDFLRNSFYGMLQEGRQLFKKKEG